MNKHVAIYGGSFNPIHLGHLAVAQSVVNEKLANEVWLMVSPQNPLKPTTDLLPEVLRYELAITAVKHIEGVCASDFEFHLPRPSYTWRTLAALETAHPDTSFTLLIGSDNWQIFPRWAHHDELLTRYGLIIYPRPDYPVRADELPPQAHLLHAPLFPHSSTEIRDRLRRGLSVTNLVPTAVAKRLKSALGAQARCL